MLPAIDFDYEPVFEADQINDEIADRNLASKLQTLQLPSRSRNHNLASASVGVPRMRSRTAALPRFDFLAHPPSPGLPTSLQTAAGANRPLPQGERPRACGRGRDGHQRCGFPSPPCGRGLFALASEASLGAKGEGAPVLDEDHAPRHPDAPVRSVRTLAGIGPKLAETLGRLLDARRAARRVSSISCSISRSASSTAAGKPGIALAAEGAIVTLKVRVDRHAPPPRGNKRIPYRVFAHDDTGEIGPRLLPCPRRLPREAAAHRRDALRPAVPSNGSTAARRWSIPTTSSARRISPRCR